MTDFIAAVESRLAELHRARDILKKTVRRLKLGKYLICFKQSNPKNTDLRQGEIVNVWFRCREGVRIASCINEAGEVFIKYIPGKYETCTEAEFFARLAAAEAG